MSINFKKIAIWTVGIAVVGAGIYYSFKEQPAPVDMATVASGPMEVTVDADGITQIRNVFEVSAPVSGTALRSPVEVGDFVLAGETVVAILEPSQPVFLDTRSRTQAEAAVAEAESALRLSELNISAAEASYDYAQNQFERAETLSQSGTLSDNALEETKLLLEQARTALVSALSERTLRLSSLERTQAMLIEPDADGTSLADSCCIELLAPVDGSILTVSAPSERPVMTGTPLVRIGLVDDLEVVVDLLSSDIVNLPEGALAYIERWGGANVLEAEINRIDPSAFTKISALGIAEQRVRVVLDINSPDSDYENLGDGFRVFVRIIEWNSEDVLQIPINTLFRNDESWMVFRVIDGIAQSTPVEIGQRNASVAQVLSGVSIGDKLIMHPSDRIANGVLTIDRNDL